MFTSRKRSQKPLQVTAEALEAALRRLSVRFSRTDARTSQSIYYRLFRKDGSVFLRIRISDHPFLAKQENIQNILCIGSHVGTEYELDTWYKVLPVIGNASHCVEVKKLSAKIAGEAALKNKTPSEAFQKTLENIRKKATRRASSGEAEATTEKQRMEALAKLLAGFAARFDLYIQKSTIPSGYMFRFQYSNWRPACVTISRHRPDALPQDCAENMVLVGAYGAANFRCQEWEDILCTVLKRIGLTGKTHKKALERFIEKKRLRFASILPSVPIALQKPQQS